MNNKEKLIDELQKRGIRNKAVLDAIKIVPRETFISSKLEHQAYLNAPLSIGYDQTISQPLIVAMMTELAQVSHSKKILEIGTGSGYQTAILAELGAHVWTIERIPELHKQAQLNLKNAGYTKHILFKLGSGYKGWKEHAPYDAILITASPPEIPGELIEQLKVGGVLISPEGIEDQNLIRITKLKEDLKRETLFPVRFVPMV